MRLQRQKAEKPPMRPPTIHPYRAKQERKQKQRRQRAAEKQPITEQEALTIAAIIGRKLKILHRTDLMQELLNDIIQTGLRDITLTEFKADNPEQIARDLYKLNNQADVDGYTNVHDLPDLPEETKRRIDAEYKRLVQAENTTAPQ